MKRCLPIEQLELCIGRANQTVSVQIDGEQVRLPLRYVKGTCSEKLKWKNSEDSTCSG